MWTTLNNSELMTWRYNPNQWQPLSRVTLGNIDDIPLYVVDYTNADDYPFATEPPLQMAEAGLMAYGDVFKDMPYTTKDWDFTQIEDIPIVEVVDM